jgi:hypothetical protein
VAAAKGGLGVVFDTELNLLGDVLAGELGGETQAEVDTRRDAKFERTLGVGDLVFSS